LHIFSGSGQRAGLSTCVSSFIGRGDFDQVERWLIMVFHRISHHHASRGLGNPHLDLGQVRKAHRIVDRVILDRANSLIRKVSMGVS
jgi:hypothetical protein